MRSYCAVKHDVVVGFDVSDENFIAYCINYIN